MKVPGPNERDRTPSDQFTLPTIGSYGYAGTLEMTTRQKEAAKGKKKQLAERGGFGFQA